MKILNNYKEDVFGVLSKKALTKYELQSHGILNLNPITKITVNFKENLFAGSVNILTITANV